MVKHVPASKLVSELIWKINAKSGPYNETIWNGIPPNLDSAFIDQKGVTHFVKGQKTWEFNRMELK